jgi:hypothetical protein
MEETKRPEVSAIEETRRTWSICPKDTKWTQSPHCEGDLENMKYPVWMILEEPGVSTMEETRRTGSWRKFSNQGGNLTFVS